MLEDFFLRWFEEIQIDLVIYISVLIKKTSFLKTQFVYFYVNFFDIFESRVKFDCV